MTITNDYTTELMSLKTEIISLCNIITSAVAEIKNAIMSTYTDRTLLPTSNVTETDHPRETQSPNQPLLELQDTIHELKHDIATIVIETCKMFHQQATKMMLAYPKTALGT